MTRGNVILKQGGQGGTGGRGGCILHVVVVVGRGNGKMAGKHIHTLCDLCEL